MSELAKSQVDVVARPISYRLDAGLHALFFFGALIIIGLSFLMATAGDHQVFFPGLAKPLPPTCTSKLILGVDCPGCGLTRAFISVSHGELRRAWNFNPAVFLLYPFVAIQIPWHGWQLSRIRHGKRPLEWTWTYYLPVVMACALVTVWIIRMLINYF